MKKIAVLIAVLLVAFLVIGFIWIKDRQPDSDTAEWGSYIGHELGFQIRYPGEWREEHCLTDGFGIVGFGEGDEQLLICNSDAPPLSYVNVAVVGLASDFESLVDNFSQGLEDSTREDILVAGQNAVQIKGETPEPGEGPGEPEGIKRTLVLLTHNNKVFLLMHSNPENKDYLDTFYKMIETFQFIDHASSTPSN